MVLPTFTTVEADGGVGGMVTAPGGLGSRTLVATVGTDGGVGHTNNPSIPHRKSGAFAQIRGC